MTVFPEGRKAPSPFRQNILQQFHGGAGVVGAEPMWPAVLGTAVSHPPLQQPPPESSGSQPAPVTTGSHYPIPAFWPRC